MNPFQTIAGWFKKKTINGITELYKQIGGGGWNSTKYLQAYEKSLYLYACVNKIAQKVASNRFKMLQIINSKGETKEIYSHPVLDLLYKPNPFQTKEEFLETTMINQKLSGNAFIFKVRNERGQVVELWNLRPDMVVIYTDPTEYIAGYQYQKTDGSTVMFNPTDIIHIKYPNPIDEYIGTSPLKPAAVRVDIEEFASKYQRDFFLNNARPDAVLEFEGNLFADQKAEITENWEKRFKGLGNNSKVATLEGGVKYQQVALSQREMDYIESVKFTRDDILVAFGVPKTVVGITDDVNRANAETAMYVFLSETVKPELERLVNKLNEELVYPDFGEQFMLEFIDPTPEDREFKLREQTELVKANIMLLNEARADRNLEPMDGGNTFYLPLGFTPIGGVATKAKEIDARVLAGKRNLKTKMEIAETVARNVDATLKAFKREQKAKQEKIIEKSPACRLDGETKDECVSRKIPEIMADAPDMSQQQAIAIAYSMCDTLCSEKDKPKTISMMADPEVRQSYYDVVNKRIDKRALTFKEAILKEVSKQQERVLANIKKFAAKGLKRKMKVSDIFNVSKENAVFANLALPFITEYLKNAGDDAISITNPIKEFNVTAAIQAALEKRSEYFAEKINQTTADKLTATLTEGIKNGEGINELSDRVASTYDQFDTYRADMIARTETTAANNYGSIEGFRQSDVVNAKEWIATMDDRTRDSHLEVNGEIVFLDDSFSNGLDAPGDGFGDPAETINCRCVIAPSWKES